MDRPFVVGERKTDCTFDFEGASVGGVTGEPVAVALFASGTRVLSRSIKYHRPRSFFCLAGHCNGCLMRIDGLPNVKSCQTPTRAGLTCERQNAFPSGSFDVLGAADFMFAKGMDHHTMFTSPRALNVVMQSVVRRLGGLGRLPDRATAFGDLPRGRLREVDVVVVGAGPAGLAAAIAIRATRPVASVLVVDESDACGGSLRSWPTHGLRAAQSLEAEARAAGVELRAPAPALAFYPEDDGGVLAVANGIRGALWRVRARAYVYASGGYDTNELFEDNDRPGILAARAVGRLLTAHGVVAGIRPVVIGDGAYASVLAEALARAGATVRSVGRGERVARARGRTWVTGLDVTDASGTTVRVRCDVVAVAATPAPASELARQHGAEVRFDGARGGFAVVTDEGGHTTVRGVYACGDVCGYLGPDGARASGERVGRVVASELA